MKLGFIGIGNMASAIVGGVLKQKVLAPEQIIASRRNEEALQRVKKEFNICVTTDNVEVAKQADILVLAVKPQFFEEVITQIKGVLSPNQIIVSMAPGKTIAWLQEKLGEKVKIVRCMPNTPALVGEGCTGFCYNEFLLPEEVKEVETILQSVGRCSEVPEKLMDVVVGVSGSSPAYVFLFIEAMADGAVAAGMPRKQAYEFAAQAVLGSAKMVLETGKHPGELKDMVCSPAGTTIQAVKVLEEKGLRGAVMDAMEACIEKSRNM